MSKSIEAIEGIGPTYGEKLGAAGINTTADLLAKCGAKGGRAATAESTGISEKLILSWTNKADLMRINGVGEEYSDLLEASGVDTVKELKHRVPENLAAKMAEVNEEKNLTRRVPNADEITKWVEEAKTMEPMISH